MFMAHAMHVYPSCCCFTKKASPFLMDDDDAALYIKYSDNTSLLFSCQLSSTFETNLMSLLSVG